jgi:hypothetical protein
MTLKYLFRHFQQLYPPTFIILYITFNKLTVLIWFFISYHYQSATIQLLVYLSS